MKTAEEILKDPQLREFLGQPSVHEGLELSRVHGSCLEYKQLMEQASTTMIELAKAIRTHAENCPVIPIDHV